MTFELGLAGWLLVTIGILDAAILIAIVIVRLIRFRKERRRAWIREFMRVAFWSATADEVVRVIQKSADEFLREFMELSDSVQLPDEQVDKARLAIVRAHQFPRLIKQLGSRRSYPRKRAAIWLGYATPEQAVRPLVLALEREHRTSVRLHIVHSLARLNDPAVIPIIVDSLAGAAIEYQQRVLGCLQAFGDEFTFYFDILRNRREPEIQRLLAEMAALMSDRRGQEFLELLVDSDDTDTRRLAVRLLLKTYTHTTDVSSLLGNDDLLVVNLAIESLGRLRSEDALVTLIRYAADEKTRKSAIVGLSSLVHDTPRLYDILLDRIESEEVEAVADGLLEVVSQRVEYLLERVLRAGDESAREVIVRLVASGRASGVISFLNRNEDPAAESLLVELLSATILGQEKLAEEFAVYARPSVLGRLHLEGRKVEQQRGKRVGEATRPILILSVILGVVLAPPIAFVGFRLIGTDLVPALSWVADYVDGFELFFGGYAFVLNMIYLGLLVAASFAVIKQQANLGLKPLSMLFRPGMLPSISIVVPAYGEEATIVENVNSLMNLRYPDYEVIVVNDGSPDNTMGTLIKQFELERTDVFVHGYLGTQSIRGIYRNPQIPELLVIDKQNGGKADSLNAGINAARKDFFAAIDSDSLLERDSLLNLAAPFLDSEAPVVATGGNIFPVNGCRVDRGSLDSIGLPRELLGRYQTLEYLRSFMAGRTGWAHIKSLMIISGAFGLFRKRDVVDAHGYLTGSGFYAKDTVAEDMELVVRVARSLREKKEPFAVQYAYNANCWTEVPTALRILRNQRDRWQRGLIDTMFFHFKMLLNPKHGAMGLVGFPYYFLFELLGPWVEVQGLLFLVIGLATGALSLSTAGIVFAATVPLGVAVSLSSLLLAEYHQRYFGAGDRIRLVLLAVLENFGYRQYASVLRLRGYISALTRRTGWGTMVRSGFSGGNAGGAPPAAASAAPGAEAQSGP
jgi:peptidoglycan-N-acetylglucosamine deacetylase